MGGGLRILSLDGGGTRGLSTLYILKEIMNQIVPGKGGSIRPSAYFDIIGASGPNALSALLFVRFAFTIDEVLNWFHDFARRIDNAEEIFATKEGEDLNEDDFRDFEKDSHDPEVQIETVRRQILSNTWSENITKQFTDWFEQSKHKEDGKFNFKNPLADVGVGRCRAAVTGSEAAGFGPKGGVVKHRIYHAPIWHRSYEGRDTKRTYTLYAIALGTVAAPGIVSNGLIFPDFSAPGADIVHNPVKLLLQECNMIWPGLRPKIILSIGTGKLVLPEPWDFKQHPHALTAAKASLKIQEENQKIADDIEKYVLPHDKAVKSAYFRFNVTSSQPFFEHEARDFISEQALMYLSSPEVATRVAHVAELLGEESFPNTWEDRIVLSSLASLSTTFASSGYGQEAKLISDCMSSYILYEPTKNTSGNHGKLVLAASADRLAYLVRTKKPWTSPGNTRNRNSAQYSPGFFLNSFLAFGEVEGIPETMNLAETLPDLSSMAEIATGCYFLLTAERQRNVQYMNSKLFTRVLHRVSKLVFMPAEITQSLIFRVETLFQISSVAALCEQACTEALTAEPRMLLSGQFIRHLTSTILHCNLQHIDERFLEPVANAISEIIRLRKWSNVRDPLIVKLLARRPEKGKGLWSLANLAIERETQRVRLQPSGQHAELSECTKMCQKLVRDYNQDFQAKKTMVARLSAEQGHLGLLRKLLEGDDLQSQPRVDAPKPCHAAASLIGSVETESGGSLLHQSAKKAFVPVLKMIVESLGMVQAPPLLSALDNDGLSPLHICVRRRGDIDTLLFFIYAGVDLDHDSLTGETALHYCFPDKEEVHDYVLSVENFAREHGLLITLPINPPRSWGIYGAGLEIDNPTLTQRRMVHQLVCRGANTNLQDRFGATPAHLAAATGWGVNIDMLFIRGGTAAEDLARELLHLRDRDNNTILSVLRTTKDSEGERIISAEMRKRCLDTSAINHPQTTPSYIQSSKNEQNGSVASRSPGTTSKPLSPEIHTSPASHSSQTETPTSNQFQQPGLTDEQLARKLQEEWDKENQAQSYQGPASQQISPRIAPNPVVGPSNTPQRPFHGRQPSVHPPNPQNPGRLPPIGQPYQSDSSSPPIPWIPAPSLQPSRPAIPSNKVPQHSRPLQATHSPSPLPPQRQPYYSQHFAPASLQSPNQPLNQSQPQISPQQPWTPPFTPSAPQQPVPPEGKRRGKLLKVLLRK